MSQIRDQLSTTIQSNVWKTCKNTFWDGFDYYFCKNLNHNFHFELDIPFFLQSLCWQLYWFGFDCDWNLKLYFYWIKSNSRLARAEDSLVFKSRRAKLSVRSRESMESSQITNFYKRNEVESSAAMVKLNKELVDIV